MESKDLVEGPMMFIAVGYILKSKPIWSFINRREANRMEDRSFKGQFMLTELKQMYVFHFVSSFLSN